MNKFGIQQPMNPNKIQIQPVNYFDPSKFTQDQVMPQPKPVDFQGGPQRMPPQLPPQRMPPQMMPPIRFDYNPGMDFNPAPFGGQSTFDNSGFNNPYKRLLLQQYFGNGGFNSGMQMF